MPMPNGSFWRVSIGGQINDTDTWSINRWLYLVSVGTGPNQSDHDAIASGQLADFNSTFWNPATNPYKAMNAAATTLATCKVYYYLNGVLTAESSSSITPVAGTSTNVQPAYCAQVFTLRTSGFGRSQRGRLYLPRTGSNNSGTTLQYTNFQAHVDNMAAFLGAKTYNGSNITVGPTVMSLTHGTTNIITKVTMDSKPDTQRGRESRSAATSTLSHTV